MPEAIQGPVVHRFASFELNLQSGELRQNGIRLRLTGQPFQVLALLVERAGEVVTREELHAKLWSQDTFVDFDHGLNNAVARIREELNDSSKKPRYIETIPRRGYRFIAPLPSTQAPVIAPEIAEPADRPDQEAPEETPIVGVPQTVPANTSRRLPFRLALSGAAGIALLVGIFLLYRVHRASNFTGGHAIKSLAVLPLKNLSGDIRSTWPTGSPRKSSGSLPVCMACVLLRAPPRCTSRTPNCLFLKLRKRSE